MPNAKIQWTQNVAGRSPGELETVEIDTDFMRGCLANGRYVVLSVESPFVEPSLPELVGLIKAESPAATTETPRPAARRKPKVTPEA